ncbi:MAG: hypothetical protein M5R40_11900 [Anaerolineae bacterium]|nr:hypothetical protein [Anaerolineae bacterium]
MSRLQRLLILGLVMVVGFQPFSMVAHAQPGEQTLIQYNTPVIVTLPPGQTVHRVFEVRQGDGFDIRLTRLSDYTYTAVLLDPLQQATPLPLDADGNSLFTVAGAPQSGQYALVLQSESVQGELLILVSSTSQSAVPLAVGATEVTLGTDSVRFSLEPPELAGEMQLSIGLVGPTDSSALPSFALIEVRYGQ